MERIKKLRKENKVRQADLAAYLGVAQNTLSYWENGKFEPDIETMVRIADYFHVSVDYLLGLAEIKDPYAMIKEITSLDDVSPVIPREPSEGGDSGISDETRMRLYKLFNSTIDNVLAVLDAENKQKNLQTANEITESINKEE